MKTVDAIIVTYNRLNLLKKCLHRLLDQSFELKHIFVINNNSTDGTRGYLNELHNPIVKPINMRKNLNGAGGFSNGIRIAYEQSDSDYFWLMDDDTLPKVNALKNLMVATDTVKDKFGFLCSNVRWCKNNQSCNMPVVSNKKWTEYSSYYLVRVQEATFVSFLVPRFIVKKLGYPIADAVIWGDDTEYSTRLSNYLPSYFVGNSIVEHEADSPDLSYKNIFTEKSNSRIARYKYMYRNRLYVERKHRSLKSLVKWIVRYILVLVEIPFKSKNRRIKRMFYVLYGILSSIFFNPKIKLPKD